MSSNRRSRTAIAKLRRSLRYPLRDGRELTIRTATPGDARELTRVLDAIATEQGPWLLMRPGEIKPRDWRNRIAQATTDPAQLIVVPTIDGHVVGNLGLYPDSRSKVCAHVRMLGMSVAEECRRLGVGSALLAAAIGWAQSKGVTRVVLSVLPHNAPAIAFYERHGFAVEGRRRGQFILGGVAYDEVLMARFLED